jgi:polyphosphate kinase
VAVPNKTMKPAAFTDPRFYLNRHVQWLEFNRRVLEEARDFGNPLLERVKFLVITANNLDDFVEVRVSSREWVRETRAQRRIRRSRACRQPRTPRSNPMF